MLAPGILLRVQHRDRTETHGDHGNAHDYVETRPTSELAAERLRMRANASSATASRSEHRQHDERHVVPVAPCVPRAIVGQDEPHGEVSGKASQTVHETTTRDSRRSVSMRGSSTGHA